MKNIFFALIAVCFGTTAVQAVNYYVATNGSDISNNGISINSPYQTVQKAASIMVAGDTCFIRGGIYRETVTPAHSGNSSSPITFTNYNNETVVVSGLDVVANIWTPDTGSIYRCTNFMGLGGSNQVFVSGAMAYEARWPNNTGTYTYFSTDHPSANGTRSSNGLTNYFTDGNFPFTNSAELNGAKIWIAPGYQYLCKVLAVRSYNPATKTIGYDSVDTGTGWLPYSYSPFYLFGCKSLLDTTNEWWYDETNQILYLWAPGNADPNTLTVEVKARDLGFVLDNLNNINISGLQLKGCRINARFSNGTILRGLNCQYILNNCSGTGNGEGIYVRGNNCEVSGCEIAYSSHALLNVELSDGCKIINNYLHDGCSVSQSRAFKMMGSRDLVSHNTICDIAGYPLRLDMRAGVFQYNEVYNGNWYQRDCGLMYNNYIDGQNTVIQFNVLHDCLSPSTGQSHAIYFDSGTSDFIIVHNIIYNNKSNGMKFNTGYHDLVYNNTLFNSSRYAIQYASVSSAQNVPTDRVDWPELVNNIATCNNITTNPPPPVEHNPYSSRELDPTVVDPNYVNTNAYDFDLTADSPAVDKGTYVAGVSENYAGLAPDIGAIEYGTSFPKVGHDFLSPPPTNLLVLPDVTVYVHRNLVKNGSFENGISGWVLGDAKTLYTPKQNSSAGDMVFNGYYSARFGPLVDSAWQTVSNLIPNMRYVATAWAKADAGETAQFSVSGFGGGTLSLTGTATKWVPLDIWFTNGPASTTATLQLKKISQNGNYVYMDLCAIKQSPSPLLPIQPNLIFQSNPLITVTNTAQYPVPGGTLVYSLLTAPLGADIDSDGIINWQPDASQVPGTYSFVTVAQDPAFPSLVTSNTFLVTLALSGPLGLTATAVSSSEIDLTWAASSGADSYNVKRSPVSSGPYTNIATGVLMTNYSDAGLAANTTYYYVVSAVASGVESAYSRQALATTFLPPGYITLTNSDPSGKSSFNSATNWSNGTAPLGTNDYYTLGFTLRSPSIGSPAIFAGRSLTVNYGITNLATPGNGLGKFLLKGPANATTIVSNLVLAGGIVAFAAQNTNDIQTLAGGITVSNLPAGETNYIVGGGGSSAAHEMLDVTAPINGSGQLQIGNGTVADSYWLPLSSPAPAAGCIRFSADNFFSGTVTVAVTPLDTTNGLLQLNHTNALNNATLNLAGTAINMVTFTHAANTASFNIGALSGTADEALTDTAGSAVSIRVGGNNADTAYSGALIGTGGSLIKTGAGTLTFTGANTYTGDTAVTGGTLGGTGRVAGTLTVQAGGTLAPGLMDAIGTLTAGGAATVSGAVVMQINRAGSPNSDELAAPSVTINSGAALTVTNSGATLVAGDTFPLFSVPVSGAFSTITLPGGFIWTNKLVVDGTIAVVSAVNTNPTNLIFAVAGNTLTLSWPADRLGWHLQAQTSSLSAGLGTNWVDVPGSELTNQWSAQIQSSNPAVFFRLRLP